MAIPIVPIVAIAALAMFAGGGGKKRKKKSPFVGPEAPSSSPGRQPTPDAPGVSGEYCPSPDGTFATYDNEGNGVVFWDQEDDEDLRDLMSEMWSEQPNLAICAPDIYVEATDEWEPNPVRVSFVRQALGELLGKEPYTWPSNMADPAIPYWVKVTWQRAHTIALDELCGYQPVSGQRQMSLNEALAYAEAEFPPAQGRIKTVKLI